MGVFEGKQALVTGGASGIGRATAERMAAEGARVAIADIDKTRGRAAAEDVGGIFISMDVADPTQVAAGMQDAAHQLGGLDIVYLNAGVSTGEGDIAKVTEEQYRRVMGVNFDHVVYGSREAVRIMEPAGGGAILATSGLVGLLAYEHDAIYAAAKHAVVGLVRGLGRALAPRNITVNVICPGMVETSLVSKDGAAYMREAGVPLLQPGEIAEAVVRAIQSGTTGQCWICRAGLEALPLGEGLSLEDVEAYVRQSEGALRAFLSR